MYVCIYLFSCHYLAQLGLRQLGLPVPKICRRELLLVPQSQTPFLSLQPFDQEPEIIAKGQFSAIISGKKIRRGRVGP